MPSLTALANGNYLITFSAWDSTNYVNLGLAFIGDGAKPSYGVIPMAE
jgi:hypothetical protein